MDSFKNMYKGLKSYYNNCGPLKPEIFRFPIRFNHIFFIKRVSTNSWTLKYLVQLSFIIRVRVRVRHEENKIATTLFSPPLRKLIHIWYHGNNEPFGNNSFTDFMFWQNNYFCAWRVRGNKDILHVYKRYYVHNPSSLIPQLVCSF